jgi:DHA1 family tetracycline resistance protein-like MFS transporter
MNDRFGYDATGVAFLLVAMAVLMGAIQGGGMRALAARFRERALVTGGSLLLGGAFLAMAWAPSVAWLLLPLAAAAVGRAVSQPSLMSLASFAADPARRGVAMGTFQSSASLARVIGPLLAGLLYDVDAVWPFLAAGVLALGVGAGGSRLRDRPGQDAPESPSPGLPGGAP